jgi:hypothetical protein
MDNHNNQKAIMEYLRSVDITNVNWIMDRPISDTYNALKSICADPLLKFFGFIWEKHHKESSIAINASQLLQQFHNYLRDNLKMKDDSIRIWNRTLFGLRMGKMCNDITGISKRINVGRMKCAFYDFDIVPFQSYLESKSVITPDEYMFLDVDSQDDDIA